MANIEHYTPEFERNAHGDEFGLWVRLLDGLKELASVSSEDEDLLLVSCNSIGKELFKHFVREHRTHNHRGFGTSSGLIQNQAHTLPRFNAGNGGEHWASASFSSVVEGILLVGADGAIHSINPSGMVMFGYEEFELLGGQLHSLIPKVREIELDDLLPTESESPNGLEHFFRTEGQKKNGNDFPVALVAKKIERNGELFFLTVVCDLSRETELETMLWNSQKMESLGVLSAGIAHDLNNIHQAISGYLEILKEEYTSNGERYTKCIDEIEKGSNRAKSLVNQMLILSRDSSVELKPENLCQIVKDELTFLRGAFPASIKMTSELECETDFVMCDPTQIHQILINLYTNSVDSMVEKEGELNILLKPITLESSQDTHSGEINPGKYLELVVKDSGLGIEQEILDSVFEPFFTTKEVGEGTGLGLSLVHKLVSNMKGGLVLESSVGEGTTVKIFLPVLENVETQLELLAPPAVLRTGNARIILIDDEEPIVDLATMLLEEYGYKVDGFTDAIAGLQAFQNCSEKYDIAILDYVMPEMNGMELAGKLKRIEPSIPIFIATGCEIDSVDGPVQNSDVHMILQKPYDFDLVIETINDILECTTIGK